MTKTHGDAEDVANVEDADGSDKSLMAWLRLNAVLVGACAALLGGVVFCVVWYTRVSDMVPMVTKLRTDVDDMQVTIRQVRSDITVTTERLNEIRKNLDKAAEQIGIVKDKMNETDAKISELLGRMDERIKGLQSHSAPLTFTPPTTEKRPWR